MRISTRKSSTLCAKCLIQLNQYINDLYCNECLSQTTCLNLCDIAKKGRIYVK